MNDGPLDPSGFREPMQGPPSWDDVDDEHRGDYPPSPVPSIPPEFYSPADAPGPRLLPRPLDNTALEAYMSCPRKYYYGMVLHRRSRGGVSPALNYGTTWHAIMEAHYKTGGDTAAVVEAAKAAYQPIDSPDDHRTLPRALSEYASFLNRWGDYEAETANWGKTVGFPSEPLVECPAEVWWPGALHPYTSKIDRIFEHQGLYYVEDHKTTSAMGATYFKQFDPSNQMMGYAWLAQKLSGLPIAGVRINAHAVLKGSGKFERQTIMFSAERLEEWAQNLNMWIERLSRSYTNHEHGIDNMPSITASEDLRAWPHNFQACAGKYGQCVYTDVCTMPARLRGKVLENDFEEKPWNPLNPDGDAE